MHKLNLYVHSVLKDKSDYMKGFAHLEELLDSIGILSTGHLLLYCFPYSPEKYNYQCYKFGSQTTP